MSEQQVNMQADDSQMVDDILNELNSGDDSQATPPQGNQQMPPQQMTQQQMAPQQMPPQQMAQQQMPPQGFPQHPDVNGMDYPGMMEMPPDVDVDYDSNDSKINKIMNSMKKPLIVIALAFILFNPYTNDLMAKYFPTVFNSDTLASKQVRVLCLSLILGLLFLAINLVV
jgi:hypothetical protein